MVGGLLVFDVSALITLQVIGACSEGAELRVGVGQCLLGNKPSPSTGQDGQQDWALENRG